MFNYLQSRIRGTAVTGPGQPPPGLLAFYWHFIGQTKGWYAAMFVASLAVALLVGAVVWANWQNDQRLLVNMPLIQRSDYIPVLIVGAILLLVFVTIGRLVGQAAVAMHRGLTAVFPAWLAFATTIVFT